MSTFIGDYSCKIDPKGRVTLPSAFQKQMPESARNTFVVKKDIFEKCLVLFPLDEWERRLEVIRAKINPYNKQHSQFLREFYKGTAEVEMDSSNRLLINKRLLDAAEIGADVVLAGQDGKIEMWSKDLYEQNGLSEDDFAALAENILGK